MLLEHEGCYGPYALAARRTLWFVHGCNGNRMLLQHAGHYGLCMDAMVTVCSRNTKDVMDRMLLQHEGDYGLGMDAITDLPSHRRILAHGTLHGQRRQVAATVSSLRMYEMQD